MREEDKKIIHEELESIVKEIHRANCDGRYYAHLEAASGRAKDILVTLDNLTDGWISIKDHPPKQEECVDIWSKSCGRLANYKYVINYAGKAGNNFFDPVRSGIVCIRDATHWMPIPPIPDLRNS